LSGVMIVMARDFREIRRGTAFRIMLAIIAAITLAAAAGIILGLREQSWLGQPQAIPILELIMALVAYFIPLAVLISFIWVFAGFSVVREKVNGNIECLLATPLTPGAVWMGKCLAIFLPAFILSVIAAMLVVLVTNFIVIMPSVGQFMPAAPALLTGLLINGLLFLALLSFIILFSLAGNPDVAIAPSFLIGFGLMIGIPLGLATGWVNLGSWRFALWYGVGTAILWLVVLYLTRLLNRQNIVLSSKGS
jgi:ABC-type transport system involved in multi-copper enzyme maturation permease subunit